MFAKLKLSFLFMILLGIMCAPVIHANTCPEILSEKEFDYVDALKKALGFVGIIKPPRQAYEIGATEFIEIKLIAEEALTLYPAEDFIYIGLGRSPTPFIAYFDALGISSALNLPLTSMRNNPDQPFFSLGNMHFSSRLSQRKEAYLFDHFDRFLPSPQSLVGKKILLIDFAQSGASLIAAQKYMNKYYSTKGIDIDVSILALTDPKFEYKQIASLNESNSISLGHGTLVHALRDQQYDDLSEFGKYKVKANSQPQYNENPLYKDLVLNFRQRLQN